MICGLLRAIDSTSKSKEERELIVEITKWDLFFFGF
jgi:hypothetical protein